MEEIWKDIKGYEGLYQISNLGRVKSLNYKRTGIEEILKSKKMRNGYLRITLNKNGKYKTFAVHRLVAEAFINNPNNLPEVNHKDEDKQNNCVWNLEYCDRRYNVNYGTRNKRVSETVKGEKNHFYGKHHTEQTKKKMSEAWKNRIVSEETKIKISESQKNNPVKSKPVLQIDKNTNEVIAEFPSTAEAGRKLGFANSHISACCRGRLKTHKGFKWKYKESAA